MVSRSESCPAVSPACHNLGTDTGVLASQITLFEILTGRTPFEASEQEQFSTPEELQVYYERTVTGLWVGAWDISVGE